MDKPQRAANDGPPLMPRWWRAVPESTTPSGKVITHPKAQLDAQAARLTTARQAVLQLDLEIKSITSTFKRTLADIETTFKEQSAEIEQHYHTQLDGLEKQYSARNSGLTERYRDAHASLMREQEAMVEQIKHLDGKLSFVNHFPVPEQTTEPGDGQ